ncbi:MAG: LiaF transmembrane domain-containing protein [Anaerocolumna sp.]
MKFKLSNLIWGIIFIVAGVGFAGNVLDLWDFNLFFRGWWTLFIIIPCLVGLIQNGYSSGNVIGLVIGGLLLLSMQGIFDFAIVGKLIVPLIFILIGLSIIFKNLFQKEIASRINIKFQGGNSEHSAIFAGNSYRMTGEKFMGTTINAIFGGVELDLRDAIIEEDVVINASAIFGGIDISVPYNVKVKVSNVPVFGGVSNKVPTARDLNAPTIYLNSTCMFGGIDIK